MNALTRVPVWLTVQEFVAWAAGSDRKWELVNGEPREMAPGRPTHAFLQAELAALVRNHLLQQGSPCRVAVEPGVIPRVLASRNLRVPDLGVACTAGDGDDGLVLTDPVLLIEILSLSNRTDTWDDVWTYTSIPSVQDILILHSGSIGAELLSRGADGAWPVEPRLVTEGGLVLESIGFQVPLADIYRTTRLRARA